MVPKEVSASRAVHAIGPFRGTAPRGGHSALPRGESGLRCMEAENERSSSDLGLAEGASRECAETRVLPDRRGSVARPVSPRDSTRPRPFWPRAAPKKSEGIGDTLCDTDASIAGDSILSERITPKCAQQGQGSSAHAVYRLHFVCTYQIIKNQ
jgi:hypothetical protein